MKKTLNIFAGLFLIFSLQSCEEVTKKVAGNSEWIAIPNGDLKTIEIYWTNTGGDGTAEIGTSDDPSTSNVRNLNLNKGQKTSIKGYVFYRSGIIDDKADTREALVKYTFRD